MPENVSAIDSSQAQAREDRVNLKAFILACIGRLVFHNQVETGVSHEQDYLAQYYLLFSEIENLSLELLTYFKTPQACDYYLIELAGKLDLNAVELLTIALVRAVEEDPMVSRVIAFVQAPIGGSRPTLGLLQSVFALFAGEAQTQWIAGSIISGMAVRSGVLNILNTDAPLPEQTVQIPTTLVLAMSNQNFLWPGTTLVAPDSLVLLPKSIQNQAKKQALSLQNQVNSILVIRSASLREARSVVSEICQQLELEPVFSNADPSLLKGLGALCLIKNSIPIFEYSLSPTDVRRVPDLPGYDGARIAIIGAEGNLESHSGSIMQWSIPVPSQQERKGLWAHYLGDEKLAKQLAYDHVHSSGRIMQLAQLSQREARLKQRKKPNREDIEQASWTTEEGNLGSLVQAITTRIPDEALVLPKNTREELKHLLQRCRTRESLDAELGITLKARYQMGVRALLVGPSGTGKTLVASWVATQLGLPLYRVDIASVVSKYIGETEKNLATLLAKAEQTEIVLLFDEADSLFGKRTDIKDSNDRHANSQTNYLLQRIEMYKGIVLLTSNSRGRFDSAFTRRLDTVIEFPLPAPEERRALWQSHLGAKHQLSMKQLNQLSLGSELAGGHISNAVLAAAVQAKSNARQIEFNDVLIGLASEYRKLGRQIPAEIRQFQNKRG
jgi:SpoVK/Ycf46/Vps4 family AAA+-type ATPase